MCNCGGQCPPTIYCIHFPTYSTARWWCAEKIVRFRRFLDCGDVLVGLESCSSSKGVSKDVDAVNEILKPFVPQFWLVDSMSYMFIGDKFDTADQLDLESLIRAELNAKHHDVVVLQNVRGISWDDMASVFSRFDLRCKLLLPTPYCRGYDTWIAYDGDSVRMTVKRNDFRRIDITFAKVDYRAWVHNLKGLMDP